MRRLLFQFILIIPFALMIFIIPPGEMMSFFSYKPVPENAVQVGRYTVPGREEEKTPLQKLREATVRAISEWLHGPEKPRGGIELIYEGTREAAEGATRLPRGEYERPEPPVWTQIPISD